MFKLSVVFLLFSAAGISAQQVNSHVTVEYTYRVQMHNNAPSYQVGSVLTCNDVSSVYEIDHTNSFKDSYVSHEGENQVTLSIKSKENEFVYKDLHNNKLFYTDKCSMEKFHIKDDLQLMKWTLNDKRKEILGYSCQEATSSYGGRFYIAYFTNDIPISNGPWRFHGLPGLILEVYSIDNVFSIEATSLEIKKESIEILNPFENKKLISWDEFLSIYRKKYDEVLRNSMTEWGTSQSLPKKNIVEYIKD